MNSLSLFGLFALLASCLAANVVDLGTYLNQPFIYNHHLTNFNV